MPRILLTNDDGVLAPGLAAAQQALQPLGDVQVVAPLYEQSATSHSITLGRPLRLRNFDGRIAVDGSPADCVFMAREVIMADAPPDVVVSGINAGANLGRDVAYSGTVAAAMEATFRGIPAIAISQVGIHDLSFEQAAEFLRPLVQQVLARGLPAQTMLNVNVPKQVVAPARFAVTSLGHHRYADVIDSLKDPHGHPVYWIGGRWAGYDDIPGSDCVAIGDGRISVTPLRFEWNDAQARQSLAHWELEGFARDDS